MSEPPQNDNVDEIIDGTGAPTFGSNESEVGNKTEATIIKAIFSSNQEVSADFSFSMDFKACDFTQENLQLLTSFRTPTADNVSTGIIDALSKPLEEAFDGTLGAFLDGDFTTGRLKAIVGYLAPRYYPPIMAPGGEPPLAVVHFNEEKKYVVKASAVHDIATKIKQCQENRRFTEADGTRQARELFEHVRDAPLRVIDHRFGFPVAPDGYSAVLTRREAAKYDARVTRARPLFVRLSEYRNINMLWIRHVTGHRFVADVVEQGKYDMVLFPFKVEPGQFQRDELVLFEYFYLRFGMGRMKMDSVATAFYASMASLSRYERSPTQITTATNMTTTRGTVPKNLVAILSIVQRGQFLELWAILASWYTSGLGIQFDVVDDETDYLARYSTYIMLRVFLPQWAFIQGEFMDHECVQYFDGAGAPFFAQVHAILGGGANRTDMTTVVGGRATFGHPFTQQEADAGNFTKLDALKRLCILCNSSPNAVIRSRGAYFKLGYLYTDFNAVSTLLRETFMFARMQGDRLDLVSPRALDRDSDAADSRAAVTLVTLHPATVLKAVCMTYISASLAAIDEDIAAGQARAKDVLKFKYGLVGPICTEMTRIRGMNYFIAQYYYYRDEALAMLSALNGADLRADRAIARLLAKHILDCGFSISPELYAMLEDQGIQAIDLRRNGILTDAMIARSRALLDLTPLAYAPVESRIFSEDALANDPWNTRVANLALFAEMGYAFGYVLVRGRQVVVVPHDLSHTYSITYDDSAAVMQQAHLLTDGDLDAVEASKYRSHLENLAIDGPVFIRSFGKVSVECATVEVSMRDVANACEKGEFAIDESDLNTLTRSGVVPAKIKNAHQVLVQSRTLTADQLQVLLRAEIGAKFLLFPARTFLRHMVKVHPLTAVENRNRNGVMEEVQHLDSLHNARFFEKVDFYPEVKIVTEPKLSDVFMGAKNPELTAAVTAIDASPPIFKMQSTSKSGAPLFPPIRDV